MEIRRDMPFFQHCTIHQPRNTDTPVGKLNGQFQTVPMGRQLDAQVRVSHSR